MDMTRQQQQRYHLFFLFFLLRLERSMCFCCHRYELIDASYTN